MENLCVNQMNYKGNLHVSGSRKATGSSLKDSLAAESVHKVFKFFKKRTLLEEKKMKEKPLNLYDFCTPSVSAEGSSLFFTLGIQFNLLPMRNS